MSTIYKNNQAKIDLMNLYDFKLQSLNIDYSNIDINSKFGRTRVVKAGNENGKKIVLFHGYNAGAPITLEAIKGILNDYCFYVVETIGQATKSEEKVINIKDDSFALWANEILTKLNIQKANIVGISYGAFIAEKLIAYSPQSIEKCILVVPSGIVNGSIWESTKKLTFPLIRWRITKNEKHLKSFLSAFVPIEDDFLIRMLSLIMKGIKLDTRIPKLLKPKATRNFKAPVYIIAAKNDVYFPGEKVAKRSKELFSNLKEVYLLENSKHMPSKDSYSLIQQKIKKWIN
ncbi:pimeloyl-ACP methyl ester carboxylesterase [Aquimarina sp. MAR_2010_214]|uniref:alpha/beta fold hydrolase n=1 Tax=Aquimarina sp. MAR_2010_214 TaxID=1250026 RepID=UPI000C70CF28|nr:alpha/beta hydrolase [Aquimarina sp. MAR_2010_214]PKV50430.1 pimeloyl-ACP methyl ester carboxylesterase [Aquimarina sp. MAR_2010_214]